MPALRFYSLSILAACLAQAWAGPADSVIRAVRRDGHGGDDNGQGGFGGFGAFGEDQNKNYDEGQPGAEGWDDYNAGGGDKWDDHAQPDVAAPVQKDITVTFTEWATVTAPAPEQKNVGETVTVTETAVAPCDKNVVTATAYVTTCPDSAPPAGATCTPCADKWPAPPANAGGLGNCPVVTTSGLMLGLTAIPKEQAVQTGVTVAGVPGAPAAAAAVTSGASSPVSPASGDVVAETSTSVSVPLSTPSPGCTCGGGGLWGAPNAYSAPGMGGGWPAVPTNGNFFWTKPESVVWGLSSIPNTMVVKPGHGEGSVVTASAPVSAADATLTVSAGVFASGAAPEDATQTSISTTEVTTTSAAAVEAETTSTTTSTTTAADVEEAKTTSAVPSSTSTSASTPTSTSSPPVFPAASSTTTTAPAVPLSAPTDVSSAISYGHAGILGIDKRFVVVATSQP